MDAVSAEPAGIYARISYEMAPQKKQKKLVSAVLRHFQAFQLSLDRGVFEVVGSFIKNPLVKIFWGER